MKNSDPLKRGQPMRAVDAETLAAMIATYNEGNSLDRTASRFGVSTVLLGRFFDEAGVTIRPPGKPVPKLASANG
jgi:hypothetical protein